MSVEEEDGEAKNPFMHMFQPIFIFLECLLFQLTTKSSIPIKFPKKKSNMNPRKVRRKKEHADEMRKNSSNFWYTNYCGLKIRFIWRGKKPEYKLKMDLSCLLRRVKINLPWTETIFAFRSIVVNISAAISFSVLYLCIPHKWNIFGGKFWIILHA